ncbi:beta-lactamase family protein [Pseudoflavitalea sp. G-6-1-2]|uniref:serine hydrolase domain-containing protein n=1 Tax=Pseudoflavitalea sp. G-6-1-2 TaxID=2728841 RepID=UPI00146F2380|nr:serine hydrolase domain-containing protein [Pseudoflavitalea sp. G-6-1-2]NML23687.1 beta-lactamase family protein [Pseudoflavitalea sp. G-6-1-2]
MKKSIAICLWLFAASIAASAQQTSEKVSAYLDAQMTQKQIPGLQVLVMHGDKTIYSTNKGLAEISFQSPVKSNTIFSINSTSKIFAGVAIMQLAEAGKLQLNDAVGKHLPNLPQSWHQVTILQLLSHQSGLPNIEDDITEELIGGKGPDTAWALVQRQPLLAKPGETFNYITTNYVLIQKLIEKYSGMNYEDWITQQQFVPAGMKSTFYANSNEAIKDKGPTYSFYSRNPATGELEKGNKWLTCYEIFPHMARADAGVFSTSEELANWMHALKNGTFLKKQGSLQTLWTPVKLNNGKTKGFGDNYTGYAMGWSVLDQEKHPYVSALGGGRAVVNYYPKEDLTVILLTNLTGCRPAAIAEGVAAFFLETVK